MTIPQGFEFTGAGWYDRTTGRGPYSYDGVSMTLMGAGNVATLRDAFETYDPVNGGRWVESRGSGDLVFVDGNAAAASYLVISKDPLQAGTETVVTSLDTVKMPIEASIGLSMSQRTLGQEMAVEFVDTLPSLPDVPDIAIASITQALSVLTVDTVAPHGLYAGRSIGIFGCANELANYPSLVVATVTSPTQFTVTAGPGGTIASQTIANPSGEKGFVYFRERLGRAQNGVSQIFENPTVTNSSFYVRSESGDVLPSGTVAGNHSVTIATTASTQIAPNTPYTYSFSPSTEYRYNIQSDRVQCSDTVIDTVAQSINRLLRVQVCPDPLNDYRLRFRATNNKALTVPAAQIVSAVKATPSATATITTDVPHGFIVGDPVVVYGIRDQTNFANLLVATGVASVIDATSFTIVIGTAVISTSYGGYVAKVQGGNLMSALGASAVVAQSAVLSTLADGTRQLVITGNTTWAAGSIGDLVNVVGMRADLTGTSLGMDGPWKIANQATTFLTLVLPFPGQRTLPADFASTNCGGAIIKRTDIRVSFVRVFEFQRERVELLSRPAGDMAGAVPVVPQGGTIASVTGVTTVSTVSAVTSAGTPLAPATPYILNSLASTNIALILTGSSGLQAFYATNIGATPAFVKLYNKATAPVLASDVPAMVITVPAAVAGVPGAVEITPGFNGYRFALGLGIAITGGVADTDATAVAAGQVKVMLSRTV
jgi:hypothetical protein